MMSEHFANGARKPRMAPTNLTQAKTMTTQINAPIAANTGGTETLQDRRHHGTEYKWFPDEEGVNWLTNHNGDDVDGRGGQRRELLVHGHDGVRHRRLQRLDLGGAPLVAKAAAILTDFCEGSPAGAAKAGAVAELVTPASMADRRPAAQGNDCKSRE